MAQQQGRTPRIAYAVPTVIRAGEATRHRWGDAASGYVDDEVLISSSELHSIIFTLPPRGSFVHSRENPTIFRADIVYVVLAGTLLLADPEHGQLVRAETGDAIFFRRDTWHDGFARGSQPVRVLELFAPPPASGASSAHARKQPFLETPRYGQDQAIGHWPDIAPDLERARRLWLVPPGKRLLRLEGDLLWSIVASTEHVHAATGELMAGGEGTTRGYGGDALLHVTGGHLVVAAELGGSAGDHTAGPGDTFIAPHGTRVRLRATDEDAAFILGVAPAYDDASIP